MESMVQLVLLQKFLRALMNWAKIKIAEQNSREEPVTPPSE